MWCVKAPMLATYSLLPIIQRFAKPMGVEVIRKNGQFVFLRKR
jgi:monomeric isocitrate dehydrogenase